MPHHEMSLNDPLTDNSKFTLVQSPEGAPDVKRIPSDKMSFRDLQGMIEEFVRQDRADMDLGGNIRVQILVPNVIKKTFDLI